MRVFTLISALLFSKAVFTQQELKINFELETSNSDLQINQLRYYISSITLMNVDEPVFVEPDSYHLIDLDDESSLTLSLRVSENVIYDALVFNIGVDSAKNMQGVHGGDLDPTKGMYWTWQSGYINFKLEGSINGKEISYHIGGFMYPNNACRSTQLSVPKNSKSLTILVSPDQLFRAVDYEKINQVMSPGKSANFIADVLPTLFSIK